MSDPRGDTAAGRTRVLVVDDEAALARSLVRLLELRGFAARAFEDGDAAVAAAAADEADVMLVDLRMPRRSGMEVLAAVKKAAPHVEVIMMTAYGDVDTAVAAVKAGAYDFLTKPFSTTDAVAIAVAKAAERKHLVDRARALETARFGEIVGSSARMREVYRLAEGVAASSSTVLILGESGTGKELVARAIHQQSQRADRPLVTVNCGAIPSELVESELFGHIKGAFTGATMARQGLFEAADKGTIFLDEVGDLPLPAQVKLLRTLQEGEIKRVGSNEPRTVDVRVIAATHRELRARIREGQFREDLYYRLNVISLALPPLRDRREDIPLLAAHFLRKYALRMDKPVRAIAPETLRELEARAWPGNVRQLENAVEAAVVLTRGETLLPEDLPLPEQPLRRNSTAPPPVSAMPTRDSAAANAAGATYAELPYAEARRRALLDFERGYVASLLERAGNNISQAARAAGLDRSNFKRVVRRARGEDETDERSE